MKEGFLQRWSRLKRDTPAASAETPAAPHRSAGVASGAAAAPPLPALESLEFSSDFTAFMGDEVEAGLRRVALQKLFHAEHFNVMDGLDVYVEDYNSFEPVGEELLNNLNQARGLIFDVEEPVLESSGTTSIADPTPRVETVPSEEPPATQEILVDKKP